METIKLYQDPEIILNPEGDWEKLHSVSRNKLLFLTAPWLRAIASSYHQNSPILIPIIYENNVSVAGAAFINNNGVIEFLGTGPSDYLDFVLAASVPTDKIDNYINKILNSMIDAVPNFKCFSLKHMLSSSPAVNVLLKQQRGSYGTIVRERYAPFMAKSRLSDVKNKLSLRRKYNRLNREGQLNIEVYHNGHKIINFLPELYSLHIARWQKTKTPSSFIKEHTQNFYIGFVTNFSDSTILRYTRVIYDGQCIANHLGFLYDHQYLWYKPAYDPNYQQFSPGEVLLRHLFHQGDEAQCDRFDFGLGLEPFKLRFSDQVQKVVNLHITKNYVKAMPLRIKQFRKSKLVTKKQKNKMKKIEHLTLID